MSDQTNKSPEQPATPPVQHFLLNEGQGQALIDYLVSKPYAEVAGLIKMLQSLPKVQVQQAPAATEAPTEPKAGGKKKLASVPKTEAPASPEASK